MDDHDDQTDAAGVPGSDDGDHYGQDGGRETLTAGEAQRQAGAGGEQDLPAMAQNNSSDAEKIDGIVRQTRADLAGEDGERVQAVLRQRFAEAGLEVSDAEIARLTGAAEHRTE